MTELNGTSVSPKKDNKNIHPIEKRLSKSSITSEEEFVDEKVEGKKESEAKDAEIIPPISYFTLYSASDRLEKTSLLFALVCSIAAGALLPVFSIIFGDFTNAFGMPGANFMHTVEQLSLKFLYLGIGAGVSAFFATYLWTWTAARQANRLNYRFLASTLVQEIGFFDTAKEGTGGLLQCINQDIIDVQEAMGDKFQQLVRSFGTFITGFIIAFIRGWDMTLVMLGCLPLMLVVMGILTKQMAASTQRQNAAYAKASIVAQQAIAQIRTVFSYVREKQMIRDYIIALEPSTREGESQGIAIGIMIGGFIMTVYCSIGIALVYGAYRIAAGHYNGGKVMNVLMAVMQGGMALGQGGPNMQHVIKGRVSGARIFRIISREPKILIDAGEIDSDEKLASASAAAGYSASNPNKRLPKTVVVPGSRGVAALEPEDGGEGREGGESVGYSGDGLLTPGRGLVPASGEAEETRDETGWAIDFVNVSFAFPARPDTWIFRDFSLTAPAGKTMALVGESGSGKSTAVALVERFYDPASGQILLNGVDLRSIRLSWLRYNVGLVSQEPTLFATTVYDNIAMGKPNASKEEVEAAAQAANATSFIERLPLGFRTKVGERGLQLSGGQKQRIAIARAILKNPKILLLDEATSALDTQSERVVQAALDRVVHGRTCIVIAHRLSTIRNAHCISVMSKGMLLEQGTHDELLAKPDGAYGRLMAAQTSHKI